MVAVRQTGSSIDAINVPIKVKKCAFINAFVTKLLADVCPLSSCCSCRAVSSSNKARRGLGGALMMTSGMTTKPKLK